MDLDDGSILEQFTLDGEAPRLYRSPNARYGVVIQRGDDLVSFVDSGLYTEDHGDHMHGVAKMVGDRLFVTRRDSSITDTTLPAEVERYQLDSGSFTHEHLYAEQCPRLHGAAANHHALAFGCSDGVMVIDLEDDTFRAEKLDNPPTLTDGSRIGTLVAHHDVDALVGVAQGFDGHGETFYVFGSDGKLRLFDPADSWALVATLDVMEPLAEGQQVAFTESANEDRLFALTPDGQSIIEIDTHEREVLRTIALDFQVWLGLMGHSLGLLMSAWQDLPAGPTVVIAAMATCASAAVLAREPINRDAW